MIRKKGDFINNFSLKHIDDFSYINNNQNTRFVKDYPIEIVKVGKVSKNKNSGSSHSLAEDADGKTWISYNAPSFLQERHNLPAELLPNITAIEVLAAKASE